MADFSHLNDAGEGRMVDVSAKIASQRVATMAGEVRVSEVCAKALSEQMLGEIYTTARIAGVQAAKATSQLIPYCHPLQLSKVDIEIVLEDRSFNLLASVKTLGVTGVEMEALIACQIAAATIYDMIKAVDPFAVVGGFILKQKSGGKSGNLQL